MTMQAALAEIEAKMAVLQARKDVAEAARVPHRAKLDELIAQQQAIEVEVQKEVLLMNAAMGDAQEYLDTCRTLGMLASTRMQMRAALKAL